MEWLEMKIIIDIEAVSGRRDCVALLMGNETAFVEMKMWWNVMEMPAKAPITTDYAAIWNYLLTEIKL